MTTGELLATFLADYYMQQVGVPALVVVQEPVEDTDLLELLMGEKRGAKVEIRVAERGEKRRMLDLARRNAELALRHDALAAERTRARRAQALEELREALDLEALPMRIECFDVSNLGESNTVASMVVFEDGTARRSDYRSFGIRHSEGQDDFRSMAEAVRRRFLRHRRVDEDGFDRSFASLPNLVVIDGGKGQLSAALAAMADLDLPRVAVIGLAKREEEVFVPGRGAAIVLPRDSLGLQLLQRVRDEAHRFALRHHRGKRTRAQTGVAARHAAGRRCQAARGVVAALRRRRAADGGLARATRGRARAARGRRQARVRLPASHGRRHPRHVAARRRRRFTPR